MWIVTSDTNNVTNTLRSWVRKASDFQRHCRSQLSSGLVAFLRPSRGALGPIAKAWMHAHQYDTWHEMHHTWQAAGVRTRSRRQAGCPGGKANGRGGQRTHNAPAVTV